jgi:dipeptide/tripeptide permease
MGLLIAPALFRILPDRVLAGAVAGRLFTLVAYCGLACAACLLLLLFTRSQSSSRLSVWLVVAMAALTAAGEFGIQPILAGLKAAAAPADVMESALRSRFVAWHAIASGVYLFNCALGAVLVVLQNRAAG